MMSLIQYIANGCLKSRQFVFAFALISCLFFTQSSFSQDEEHGDLDTGVHRPANNGRQTGPIQGCPVTGGSLADITSGEEKNFAKMIDYLSLPACEATAAKVSFAAGEIGIPFSSEAPYRLDYYSAPITRKDEDAWKQNGATIASRISGLLSEKPLVGDKALPLIGQLAVLSPEAGRKAVIDLLIRNYSRVGDTDAPAGDLASGFLQYGVDRALMGQTLAKSIESLAETAQVFSLGRVLQSLGKAAGVEKKLVPTFTLSATALNVGIQKGSKLYTKQNQSEMAKVVFGAIKSANESGDSMESALAQLNQALTPLIEGVSVDQSALKGLWKETLKILANSPGQSVLAEMVSNSLTSELLFLSSDDRDELLVLSKNYPEIAAVLQVRFLEGLKKLRLGLSEGSLSQFRYHYLKRRYLEPWVEGVLSWPMEFVGLHWLRAVVAAGLVDKETIEKRFPVAVLASVRQFEESNKNSSNTNIDDKSVIAMAQNLGSLWTMTSVQVPVLMEWIQNYEKNSPTTRELASETPTAAVPAE